MSTWSERIAVIPRTAKVIAVLLAIGFAVLIILLSHLPPSHGEAPLPLVAKVLLPILTGSLMLVWALLVGFVYGDAKQRGMRYQMWTWLAALIPDCIGVILYFILRDPLPTTCPHCSTKVVSKFAFCPSCGTSLKPTCPQCGQAVEPIWSNCGHCGTRLPGPIPRTT
jgi:hypothetical protein